MCSLPILHLPGGIQLTTTYSNGSPGTATKRYFLKDNIGSLDIIFTSTGTVEQALSFDAWGLTDMVQRPIAGLTLELNVQIVARREPLRGNIEHFWALADRVISPAG
ncbi:MAG: hypothetical protein ABW049_08635 [Spongiibacteraceae bacterium]